MGILCIRYNYFLFEKRHRGHVPFDLCSNLKTLQDTENYVIFKNDTANSDMIQKLQNCFTSVKHLSCTMQQFSVVLCTIITAKKPITL